jgi:ABC-type sugar transport system permease subunit
MNGKGINKYAIIVPLVITVFTAAIAWGQILQQNGEQDRRITNIEIALVEISSFTARQERIDERTLNIQQEQKSQREMLENIIRFLATHKEENE